MTALLSRMLDPNSVGAEGREVRVEATPEERAAIAANLGLLDLNELAADLVAQRSGKGRIALTGKVRAKVVQSCVVSLEPVPQTVEETFGRRFVPERSEESPAGLAEVDIAVDETDPPEPYGTGGIDVGAIVLEHLILGLDPYPRAPGASLPEAASGPEDKPESPFAILKAIGHSDRA